MTSGASLGKDELLNRIRELKNTYPSLAEKYTALLNYSIYRSYPNGFEPNAPEDFLAQCFPELNDVIHIPDREKAITVKAYLQERGLLLISGLPPLEVQYAWATREREGSELSPSSRRR